MFNVYPNIVFIVINIIYDLLVQEFNNDNNNNKWLRTLIGTVQCNYYTHQCNGTQVENLKLRIFEIKERNKGKKGKRNNNNIMIINLYCYYYVYVK